MSLELEDRQQVLETLDLNARMELLLSLMDAEIDVQEMEEFQRQAQLLRSSLDTSIQRDRAHLQSLESNCEFMEVARQHEYRNALSALERNRQEQDKRYAETLSIPLLF